MERLKSYKLIKEVVMQLFFLLILFFFYSFDKHNPGFEWRTLVFFVFYTLVATFISYYLVPIYFYKKRYALFCIWIVAVLGFAYIMEELVLEKLLFTGKRADYVSNVFYTLLGIVPIIFIMVIFKLAWDAIKKHNEIEKLQLSVQESELRFLKSQINPHFLFNNLNNLYSYAIENSPKTPSIIIELSSVLRYMLYDCKEDFVPLAKEIEHLKHFTTLNELQIENRGSVNFSAETKAEGYTIAPLILSMFVENAFKHSTASQSENITIDVSLFVNEKGELNFNCKNSFLSNPNYESLSKGIGLENVKKRLEILYPDKHSLTILAKNNIYDVSLALQLKPNFQNE